jgi:diguanylate cyclase (GGDEF)-like protein/PAS domain S-box-containing protein
MKKSTLPKLLHNPYILISAMIFVVLNITVAGTTFFYSANVERLVYRETFKHLEVTRDVKLHALQLYFSDHYDHLDALVKSSPVANLVRRYRGVDDPYFSAMQADTVPHYHSDIVQTGEIDENRLKESLAAYGFQNVMLLDSEHADVLFSTESEMAAGTSLAEEPLRSTFLYWLWEKAVRYKSSQMADMSRILESGDPYICLAAPVFHGMELSAVLMVKLPADGVNEIMHFRSGMGRTEESYAVGEDHLVRSDSYLNPEHYSVSASFAEPSRGRVDTEAVSAALKGKEGHGVIVDYRGIPVFSAYKPLYLDGFVWAVMSEIDEAEVAEKINDLKTPIYLVAAVLYAVITLLSYFVVRRVIAISVVKPLKASYQRTKSFREIIDNSLNEIYLFRPDDLRFVYINRGAARNTGYTHETIQQICLTQIEPDRSEREFRRMVEPLVKGEEEMLVFEGVHRRRDGSQYDVEVRMQFMEFEGKPCFVAVANDITVRNRALEEKEVYCNMAQHDHLTNIYNRKHFDEMLHMELSRFKRYGEKGSLVMFDIDHFKKVNDTFGHDLGDEVLKTVTRLVQDTLRESDVFARWGGEEFVLLLPHTDFHGACDKAEALREYISESAIETVGRITCSFGVVDLREGESQESLFRRLDRALYQAKREGRNRTAGCRFDEDAERFG